VETIRNTTDLESFIQVPGYFPVFVVSQIEGLQCTFSFLDRWIISSGLQKCFIASLRYWVSASLLRILKIPRT